MRETKPIAAPPRGREYAASMVTRDVSRKAIGVGRLAADIDRRPRKSVVAWPLRSILVSVALLAP